MLSSTSQPLRVIVRKKSARSLVSSVLLSKGTADWQTEPVANLKEELKKRGLPAKGNKSTLIKRLVQADHSRELTSLSTLSTPAPTHTHTAAKPSPPPVPPLPTFGQAHARLVSSTARVHIVPTSGRDKFAPRPHTFAVELPDPEPEPEEPGPNIPFLADNFSSTTEQSASPTQEPAHAGDMPKVLTVASASTHLSGGPVSNVFESADAHAHELKAEAQAVAEAAADKLEKLGSGDAAGVWGSVKEAIGWEKVFGPELEGRVRDAVVQGAESAQAAVQRIPDVKAYVGLPDVKQDTDTGSQDRTRDLSPEERTGLWTVSGIFAGGWLLAGIFAPAKPKHHKETHDEHDAEH